MWDIKTLLWDARRCSSLQEWVNRRFNTYGRMTIIDNSLVDEIKMGNGDRFKVSHDLLCVFTCPVDYKMDINKDDIVVDIGANIGGFSIPATRLAKIVYSIEPMMDSELEANLILNNQIPHIITKALGDGSKIKLEWYGKYRDVDTLTLTQIKQICGGCDFLKCDCEGAEWFIQPEEFKGIRRIEMEVHGTKRMIKNTLDKVGEHKCKEMAENLVSVGFRCDIQELGQELWIIHATNRKE